MIKNAISKIIQVVAILAFTFIFSLLYTSCGSSNDRESKLKFQHDSLSADSTKKEKINSSVADSSAISTKNISINQGKTKRENPSTAVKSDTSTNQTIITKQININEIFTLDFKTCHTCGYNWIIDNKYDSTKLKFISLSTIKNPQQKIGGYETESWSFQGLAKGEYQLIFVYKRPWLKEIAKKTIVNIKVK